MSKLVIVESPAKAKTIKKYLGRGFEVLASNGHIRDLPKSKLGVDIEQDFEPQYINIKGKADLIKKLKSAAGKSNMVYLATDPDREGEAISWHLSKLLALPEQTKNRVTFSEITKSGIAAGMASPREVDDKLVDAQQARRVLDRLVGYKLSPVLWRKIRVGLSAGRVQSATLKLIIDREEEIRQFKAEEYWTIDARLQNTKEQEFTAKLATKAGKKIVSESEQQANAIVSELQNSDFIVDKVKKGKRQKHPSPPFTTSTLQQEASRRLGFQSARTMRAAQELYDGVEIKGMGATGLITYMRTDSLRISDEARTAAKQYISEKFGKNYLPEKDRYYSKKSGVQDAHEAIRPAMPELEPKAIKDSLSADQYKLYKLIWERFLASQMASALLDTVSVEIKAGQYGFRASGHTVAFDGFTRLYEEAKDGDEEKAAILPPLTEEEKLALIKLDPDQHFTEPPPRYTEASLIKAMEENGIGRPSTYAPTITTVLQRDYVEREGKTLKPTTLGEITSKFIETHFPDIVDLKFTAGMEQNLDNVEAGELPWKQAIRNFYGEFEKQLEKAEKELEGTRIRVPDEVTEEICELCGRNMVIKSGRFGKFLACPGYPECKNTKKIMTSTGAPCPECGKPITKQKSKKGKIFYGCSGYPDCKFVTWDEPLKTPCPQCGGTLFKKSAKGGGTYCSKCEYKKTGKEKTEE